MVDGIKVLLIEDDTAARIGSEQALRLGGFSVESFESAASEARGLPKNAFYDKPHRRNLTAENFR